MDVFGVIHFLNFEEIYALCERKTPILKKKKKTLKYRIILSARLANFQK